MFINFKYSSLIIDKKFTILNLTEIFLIILFNLLSLSELTEMGRRAKQTIAKLNKTQELLKKLNNNMITDQEKLLLINEQEIKKKTINNSLRNETDKIVSDDFSINQEESQYHNIQEDTDMEVDKSSIFNVNSNNENITYDLQKLKSDLINELKNSNKEEIEKIKEAINDINSNIKILSQIT